MISTEPMNFTGLTPKQKTALLVLLNCEGMEGNFWRLLRKNVARKTLDSLVKRGLVSHHQKGDWYMLRAHPSIFWFAIELERHVEKVRK